MPVSRWTRRNTGVIDATQTTDSCSTPMKLQVQNLAASGFWNEEERRRRMRANSVKEEITTYRI